MGTRTEAWPVWLGEPHWDRGGQICESISVAPEGRWGVTGSTCLAQRAGHTLYSRPSPAPSPTCCVAAQNWRWRNSTFIWMPTAAGRQERGDKARRLGGGDSGREQTVREKNSTELKEEAHEQALGERVPGHNTLQP